MKRLIGFTLVLSLLVPVAAFAGGLDDFLSSVNIQARADLPGFSAKLSAQFGVPAPRVQAVIQAVHEPADAFMVLQLGQMSRTEPERVVTVYNRDRKRGWGVIAKELGIKPGSADFHALKNGNLSFTGAPEGTGNAPGKGKSKGKGHGKGHNK